jgi:hypothetical protein
VVALVAVAALVGASGFWTAGIGGLVAANELATSLSAPPAPGSTGESGEDDGSGTGAPLAYEIGDCFQEESDDRGNTEFRDCSEPHDYEVYSEFELPDTPDGSYPGDDRMSFVADEGCLDAFEDFVGVPWEESYYDFSWVAPDEVTWTEHDDRLVQCLAIDPEGEHAGSLEGVGE